MDLYRETILGVILLELGKFLDISRDDLSNGHYEQLNKYVDTSKLYDLLNHGIPEDNWILIQRARSLVHNTDDLNQGVEKAHPLCSIFSNISIDGTYPQKMYYKPAMLSMSAMIAIKWNRGMICDYSGIKADFIKEMDLLLQSLPQDFDAFLVVIDTLMKKYLWCIPASEYNDEDVSLYDCIRTEVAITAALLGCDGEASYVMVAGHFSGIQNYIFSVSKVGTAGVAKRLRARSFYVNAMISSLAHSIVHKFNLPMENILMLTGGKFYLLLPGTGEVDSILNDLEKEALEFLYKKFRGNLSFELVWEKIDDEGILNYNRTIAALSDKIDKKKNQRLKPVLINGNEWNIDRFVVYDDLYNKSMCKACKSALVDKGKEMCNNCENDTEIGTKLPKIKLFSFSRNRGQYELFKGYYLNLDNSVCGDDSYMIMKLNDMNVEGMYHLPVTTYHAVNHVPVNEIENKKGRCVEVKTFTEIAQSAKGIKKIGILKADVDTLGFIFSDGLLSEDKNLGTITRVNTLSRMLELFFNGYLHHIIRNKYKNVYCVFSGGDDLFLIGPWNEMPALAIEINKCFHEFTGFNKCMTLSAAICVANGNGHISTLAEYCEKKLEVVKKTANNKIYPNKLGRDGVYFLHESMSWDDFEKQINIGKRISEILPITGISAMRRLAEYSRMYQAYQNDGNVDELMFLPLFSGDMNRNYKDFSDAEWFLKYSKYLYRKASMYKVVDKEFYFAKFSITYALNLNREDRSQ